MLGVQGVLDDGRGGALMAAASTPCRVEDGQAFYSPSTSPEDFCGLTKADRAYLAEHGLRFEALRVLRFHDALETSPWFYRQHELLGYVFAVTDRGMPCDEAGVLATARETFGLPCNVMW